MSIFKAKIKVSSEDGFGVKGLAYFKISYGKAKETVHVNVSDWNYKEKRVLFFSGKQFRKLITKKENGEYLYPECAEFHKSWGDDTRFLVAELSQDKLCLGELTQAIKDTGRVIFEGNISAEEIELPSLDDMLLEEAA